MPFCGDSLDDILANAMADSLQLKYTVKEFEERKSKPVPIIPVGEENGIIYLGSLKLQLAPRLKALYLLLLRHPKGIELKAIENDYLSELNSIYNGLCEGDCENGGEKLDRTYNLKAIPKNKCLINEHITELEKNNGDINLSSCKISGGERQPYTILSIYKLYKETIPLIKIGEL